MNTIRGIFEKKPGSGVFWIRYVDAEGRYRREKIGTFTAAKKLLTVRHNAALEGRKLGELRKRSVLFKEIAGDAHAYSQSHKRSWADDVSRMKRLKEWFGDREAESLTGPEMERQLSKIAAEEKWAASTFNHYRSLLMMCFREALLAKKLSSNPARDIRRKKEDNNRVRFLNDVEEQKLREIIQANWPEHMPEFNLAVNTGLRKGSMYSLTWEMVDWNRPEPMLNLPTSKNGEPLHIPLNANALAALKAVYWHGATGRVFQSIKTGNPLENGRHWFGEALKKAKITDFHWHDLRHHFASKLRQKGANLEDIAELLCHKSLGMTKRYAHLGPKQLHHVVSVLDSDSTPVAPTRNAGTPNSVRYLN